MTVALAALLLAPSLCAFAQATPPTPPPAECSAPLALPFDGGLDPNVQPDCDSVSLYYGIGKDKDFQAARACALIERINHVDKDGSLFTGPGVLSMIYANGEGTPRNVELARKFACEIKEASPDETQARLKQLDVIAETPQQPPHFSLCTTAHSPQSWGWCEQLQLQLDDARRYAVMVKAVDGEPTAALDAFQALEKVEGEFEEQRATKEIDQSSLASFSWTTQERDHVREQFVSDLRLFAKPDFSEPVTLAVVVSHLNADYASLLAEAPTLLHTTTITVAGVQATQKAWETYRDAWLKYESLANPHASSDAIATQLSRERLTQIYKLRHP